MATYTLTYHFIARNLTPAQMSAAAAALPLNSKPITKLGMVLASDTTLIIAGPNVDRVVVYTAASALLAPFLQNLNTIAFGKALSTLVTADPVVVT